jgi:hypothetical protein
MRVEPGLKTDQQLHIQYMLMCTHTLNQTVLEKGEGDIKTHQHCVFD